MARLRESVSESLLGALLPICPGCGGGSSAIQQPPPPAPSPPQPDFSMVISASTISVTQGTTSSPVNVSVNPLNGFSGTVQVTLGGLPSGVTSNPSSPFNLGAGSNTSVVFGAAANAGTGTFTITAQETSGALSHGANLQLTVNAGVVTALPRTTFARTDSTPAADDPQGEPRRRSIAYDPANKQVFVANRAMYCVEVFSSADASRAAQISIAGASSADLSADGATVWIGTVTEQVAAIDTASLQVKALYATSGLLPVPPVPNTVFDRPEELLALSNGKLMMRLRQAQTAEALLALWDPVSNIATNLTPIEPQLFQNGLGAMARTGDRTKVLVAANDTSGELAEFDSNGNVVEGPHGLGIGRIPLVASPRTPHSQLNRTNPSFNFLILSASKVLSVLTNQWFSSSQKT